jgi:hypothetical protein
VVIDSSVLQSVQCKKKSLPRGSLYPWADPKNAVARLPTRFFVPNDPNEHSCG